MNTIIIGGGQVGFNLAKALIEDGVQVRIIEKDKDKCCRLATELDIPVICDDGTKISCLINAGIEKCDILIAVTGQDEDNLVACDLGIKKFHLKKTVARANNPKNIDIMKRLGIDIAVSSSGIIAKLIEQEVDDTAIRLISNLNRGEASISEYTLPEDWSKTGTMIMNLGLPATCVVVSVTRDGQLYIPRGTTTLFAGDELIILTTGNAQRELKKIFEI